MRDRVRGIRAVRSVCTIRAMRIVRVRGRITEVVRLRCGGVACTRIARNITVDTADAVHSVASRAACIAITGLRCEITHRGNALVQRVIGEHARIIPLRERQSARQQLHHLHGVEPEILIARHLRDHAQRLLARHRIGVAGHGIHVHAYGLNQIFQVVETLVVTVGHIADEPCGHLHSFGEIADRVKPSRADHRVADHRVHAGQRLRIDRKRRHIDARNLHARIGTFRGGHHGGEGVEIPLHGHVDDHVRVGKIGDRHIVALRGILLACFADEMIPQESRPVEFGGTEPSVIDVVGEIVGFLPAIEAAHAPTFPLRCL